MHIAMNRHFVEYNYNKKVLLHERRRHTACHVASVCYTALSPHPVPTWTWDGVPPPSPGLGMGYPPSWTWDGVTSHLDLGWGIPPDRLDGVPPPLRNVNKQTAVKRVLRTRAVKRRSSTKWRIFLNFLGVPWFQPSSTPDENIVVIPTFRHTV